VAQERLHTRNGVDERRRRAGEDSAVADSTGTIIRRLLANLRVMAQAYAGAAAHDVRLAVRDVIVAAVMFGTVMMLGLYTIGLLCAAAVLALSRVVPGWAAALIVFGAAAVVMVLLLLLTAARLRRIAVRVRATIHAAKEDARWFRTRILRID
jgi:ABC-type multidrug transport system fused ATPase/permease subunit